jgi:hypothetical protein
MTISLGRLRWGKLLTLTGFEQSKRCLANPFSIIIKTDSRTGTLARQSC